jgi:hypothetical protein
MTEMSKEFDPKLKEAAEEINKILRKYDCNASMLLVSPSHSEYLFHIDSSWSTIKFDFGPEGEKDGKYYLRFRSKKEDFPSKEAQHFATESTIHFLTSTLQWSMMVQKNMTSMLEMLKQHMKIFYKVWDS